ncbi:hypothetical protein [Streptomyces cucumeris]|uniref:hypothetical protein n=1 Tax=Streptomyces cucumeris TaxID=2962890 RepID=UPI003D738103
MTTHSARGERTPRDHRTHLMYESASFGTGTGLPASAGTPAGRAVTDGRGGHRRAVASEVRA